LPQMHLLCPANLVLAPLHQSLCPVGQLLQH
jgi:hypothetical protein